MGQQEPSICEGEANCHTQVIQGKHGADVEKGTFRALLKRMQPIA